MVKHISHRIAVLYLGRLVEMGPAEEVFAAPRHPYTRALISAVPMPDPEKERARKRIVLTGDLPSPLNPPSGCSPHPLPRAQEACAGDRPTVELVTADHQAACRRWRELTGFNPLV